MTMLFELLPIELLLIAFWYIPKRFLMNLVVIHDSVNDLHLSHDNTEALLEKN